jgi:uncharacterized protein
MRKRLRKKKHLGEFRKLGFDVDCRLKQDLSASDFDRFIDDFIEQAIEAHGLQFGGGGSPQMGWTGGISCEGRYDSTTEADRTIVENWLKLRNEVVSFRLSGFYDCWYDTEAPFGETTRAGAPLNASE